MAYKMKWIGLPFVVGFMALTSLAARADAGSLVVPEQANGNVEVWLQDALLNRDVTDVLSVFVGSAEDCCAGKTPIAGSYHVDDQRVTFDPAFDFIEGQTYTVLTHRSDRKVTEFTITTQNIYPTPQVIGIYPSGKNVPENTLRFYIHFSTPMAPHKANDFIKLVDENGKADTAAFMTFAQELWNEDRTRLTLLMDPGRIKRGVAQNLTLGPALLAGSRYSIVIEGGWPSAISGQEAPHFEKHFAVSKALRNLPNTALWQFQRPRAATDDPMVISFDRPFDQQLAQTAITIRDADGQNIAGTVSVEDHEKTWRFLPSDPWATARIRVVVDAHLEDVAGNNFRDLLDHSVGTDLQTMDHKTILLELMPSP